MADVLAEGYNVFDTKKSPSGTVKYLSSPADVITLIQSGKLQEHILLNSSPRALRTQLVPGSAT